jgi:hypothetical protein
MQNFHLTHIAVNLLLIVVMAIQPIAVCLAGVSCAGGGSSVTSSACQGCGCCEVERVGDRCSCCSRPHPREIQDPANGGCCRSDHESTSTSDSNAECRDKAVPGTMDAVESRFHSVCMCGRESQPLSDPIPSRNSSETRDNLSIQAASDFNQLDSGSDHLLATTERSAGALLVPRFSQVVFCVWRL